MLRIEELIPSLNSDYKIERHRNSYGQGFGNYMYGHGYPISYGGSALPSSKLNCYDLIYKNDMVLGEIRFVPLKHIEGIHYITLFEEHRQRSIEKCCLFYCKIGRKSDYAKGISNFYSKY